MIINLCSFCNYCKFSLTPHGDMRLYELYKSVLDIMEVVVAFCATNHCIIEILSMSMHYSHEPSLTNPNNKSKPLSTGQGVRVSLS